MDEVSEPEKDGPRGGLEEGDLSTVSSCYGVHRMSDIVCRVAGGIRGPGLPAAMQLPGVPVFVVRRPAADPAAPRSGGAAEWLTVTVRDRSIDQAMHTGRQGTVEGVRVHASNSIMHPVPPPVNQKMRSQMPARKALKLCVRKLCPPSYRTTAFLEPLLRRKYSRPVRVMGWGGDGWRSQ